jgi:hypothetical protein
LRFVPIYAYNSLAQRFFAVNELKLMLAHILENYDVKLEGPTRPPTEWFGTMAGANQTAKVLFRRRVGI